MGTVFQYLKGCFMEERSLHGSYPVQLLRAELRTALGEEQGGMGPTGKQISA